MSRTQDLVLARLRLIAMRWQGGLVDGAEPPGRMPGAGSGDAWPDAPELNPDEGLAATCSDEGEGAQWFADPDPGPTSEADEPDGPPIDPAWPPSARWVRLVGLLVVIVAIGGAVVLFTSWPRELRAEAAAVPSPTEPGIPIADPFAVVAPSASPPVLVHVAGAVRNPGVVRLPAGSRVVDAVRAAGGLRRGGELGGTNLARVLADGERIEVGGQEAALTGGGARPAGGSGGLLDLNTATSEQLDALPGIGPVTAAKILAWRSAHSRFSVVDELAEVPGIGPKTLEDLRPLVRV